MDDNVLDISEFSFSFEDENDQGMNELQNLQTKLNDLQKEIDKLIAHLKSNPEKPMIKWPNRISDIEKFEEKINKIINRT